MLRVAVGLTVLLALGVFAGWADAVFFSDPPMSREIALQTTVLLTRRDEGAYAMSHGACFPIQAEGPFRASLRLNASWEPVHPHAREIVLEVGGPGPRNATSIRSPTSVELELDAQPRMGGRGPHAIWVHLFPHEDAGPLQYAYRQPVHVTLEGMASAPARLDAHSSCQRGEGSVPDLVATSMPTTVVVTP